MTEPQPQWSPGYGHLTPGRMIRLWGREHTTYDEAHTKGPARGTADVVSHTVRRADGAEIVAYRRDNRHNDQPMPTLHGDRFATPADADRARFDAGWLVFEETVKVGTIGAYVPPWGRRTPDDDDVCDDPARADGAAADMVYGRGR